jgi:hypothetical protein
LIGVRRNTHLTMNEGTNEALNRPDPSPNRTVKLEGGPTPQPADPRQIDDLIQALGTPKHRAHRTAVDELVALGPAAVPALAGALGPDRPWLTAYRSAEALAQIGDGRATGALINALRHPNSNVRWSVVQALSEIGDSRSIMALRRVARDDRGKTSWGEAVSDTAQLALDRLQSRSIFLRLWDPIKTIFFAGLMILAVTWAFNQIQDLLDDVRTPANAPVVLLPEELTATAEAEQVAENSPAPEPTPEPTPAPSPSAAAAGVTGRVTTSANVRSGPNGNVVGTAAEGSEVEISGQNTGWYRVRLPGGQEGWISASLINVPAGANIPNIQQP